MNNSEILTSKLNEFSCKLFANLSSHKDANFFISPLSISTALTMAMSGSCLQTSDQLKTVLGLNDLTDDKISEMNREYLTNLQTDFGPEQTDVSLKLANKIFQNKSYHLQEKFCENLQLNFNSSSEAVDFSESILAANLINQWVESRTDKKIQNLISSDLLTGDTKLVLVNAIYFKGNWNFPFKKEKTIEEDFFLKSNSTCKVDMMKLNDKKFYYKRNPGGIKACVCEFGYTGRSMAMTIILPHDNVNIEEVESEMNADVLRQVFEHEPMPGPVPIHASIPKFKMEYKNELSDCLIGLGATHAFDETKADFSLISTDSEGLHISKVIHQAVIEVNEEGSEAAAATAVVMMKRSMMLPAFNFPPEEFNCNRPFLFVIHETKTNGILFMGKYMGPSN